MLEINLLEQLKYQFFKSLRTSEKTVEYKLNATITLHRRTITKWTKRYFYTITFIHNGIEKKVISHEYSKLSKMLNNAWEAFMQRDRQTTQELEKLKKESVN